jgi:hypothetical protein
VKIDKKTDTSQQLVVLDNKMYAAWNKVKSAREAKRMENVNMLSTTVPTADGIVPANRRENETEKATTVLTADDIVQTMKDNMAESQIEYIFGGEGSTLSQANKVLQVVCNDDQYTMSQVVYATVSKRYEVKGMIVTNDQDRIPLAIFIGAEDYKKILRAKRHIPQPVLENAGSDGVEVKYGALRVRTLTSSDLDLGETIKQKKKILEKEQGKKLAALVTGALRIAEKARRDILAAHNKSISPGSFIITSTTQFDKSEQTDDGIEFFRIFECSLGEFFCQYCTGTGKLFHFPKFNLVFLHCPNGCTPTSSYTVHVRNCFLYEQKIPSTTVRGKIYPAFTGRFINTDNAISAVARSTTRAKKISATKLQKK